MGRITSFSKQVIVFFLVTALIIRPTFAANLGGWTLGGGVAQGASTVYEGTKKVVINGVDYIKKGTAKITPPASAVAKVLARGVAGYALSVAVEQLLGAVDWVLDPANNQIIYNPKPQDPIPYDGQFEYQAGWFTGGSLNSQTAPWTHSPEPACRDTFSALQAGYGATSYTCKPSGTYDYETCVSGGVFSGSCFTLSRRNAIAPPEEQEQKTLPLDVVAAQVISNAESGDTNAQVATTAAAADIVAEAEKDDAKARPIVNQLENSSTTKPADEAAADKANEATGEQTKNPDKPDTTDLKLTFPIFCNWAPTVCEAAQTVISFPKTLTNWWETGKSKAEEWAISISEAWAKVKEEYANKPTENTDTQLDLPDQSDPNINTDLSFGGSCPASRSVPVSFAGIHTEIEFSFQWFCEVASIAKPVVISISAFAAALIVAGVRTEDD